jgi:hypothetical protein
LFRIQDEPGEEIGHGGYWRSKRTTTGMARVSCPPRTDSTRLLAEATSACVGDWPPVGRLCGSVERSNIKTKTFYERKTKTKPSPPEARSSLPLVALQRWHKSRFNQNENRISDTGSAGSFLDAKSQQPQTGQQYLWQTAVLPGRLLVDPESPDFRNPRSRARRRRQGTEMKLTKHRRPHGRSPPMGQLYLTHVDQSVNI